LKDTLFVVDTRADQHTALTGNRTGGCDVSRLWSGCSQTDDTKLLVLYLLGRFTGISEGSMIGLSRGVREPDPDVPVSGHVVPDCLPIGEQWRSALL
jgi:hypothetical protein